MTIAAPFRLPYPDRIVASSRKIGRASLACEDGGGNGLAAVLSGAAFGALVSGHRNSTIDPQTSYGGVVVMRKLKTTPKMIGLHVRWNGDEYILRFQVAKRGTPQPIWTAFTPAPPVEPLVVDGTANTAAPATPVPSKKDGL